MLMHASLLGGALGLALGIPGGIIVPAVNVLFLLIILSLSRHRAGALQETTTFFMVASVALAFLVIYKTNVPAKDTLAILWGSIYALNLLDLIQIGVLGLLSTGYILFFRRSITGVMYNRSVAVTSGIPYTLHFNWIVVLVGLMVGLAMRLVGALLLDALLLLPAIVGTRLGRSLRQTFLLASLTGFVTSLTGFILALVLDLPVSASVTIVAAVIYGGVEIYLRRKS